MRIGVPEVLICFPKILVVAVIIYYLAKKQAKKK
jgi:hypothetical protein